MKKYPMRNKGKRCKSEGQGVRSWFIKCSELREKARMLDLTKQFKAVSPISKMTLIECIFMSNCEQKITSKVSKQEMVLMARRNEFRKEKET